MKQAERMLFWLAREFSLKPETEMGSSDYASGAAATFHLISLRQDKPSPSSWMSAYFTRAT